MRTKTKSRATLVERLRATPALCEMIELLIANAPTREPTLGDIRASLLAPHAFWSAAQRELLYAQDQTALVIELDELIERYGAQAPARNFVDRKGIEQVSHSVPARR